MREGLDGQDRRTLWLGATETERARRIALMYRHRLRTFDRAACDDADRAAVSVGETWMLDKLDIIEPEAELTTAEAADLVKVEPRKIRDWACLDHPERPGDPLLPRFKMRGRERTYLAADVLAAAAALRRQRHARDQG